MLHALSYQLISCAFLAGAKEKNGEEERGEVDNRGDGGNILSKTTESETEELNVSSEFKADVDPAYESIDAF